jgi:16S rRNA processing protein RimM
MSIHPGYFKAGYVMRTHGLKGEVTISLEADAPVNWPQLKGLFIDINGQLVPHRIERLSIKGTRAFVKFTDISAPKQAEPLLQRSLYLPLAERPKPKGLHFYDDEVLDFTVRDKNAGPLGEVIRVERAGGNRFLIILYHRQEKMIPVNGPFITQINRSDKSIVVDLPDGFLDF